MRNVEIYVSVGVYVCVRGDRIEGWGEVNTSSFRSFSRGYTPHTRTQMLQHKIRRTIETEQHTFHIPRLAQYKRKKL